MPRLWDADGVPWVSGTYVFFDAVTGERIVKSGLGLGLTSRPARRKTHRRCWILCFWMHAGLSPLQEVFCVEPSVPLPIWGCDRDCCSRGHRSVACERGVHANSVEREQAGSARRPDDGLARIDRADADAATAR